MTLELGQEVSRLTHQTGSSPPQECSWLPFLVLTCHFLVAPCLLSSAEDICEGLG